MKVPLPSRYCGDRTRGQALVEMAIILPVLVLLLLLAIDFGRVFFGWVALNNAARIGANEVAKNPTPWAAGDTNELFYERMARDLMAANCAIPDYDGDGQTNENDGHDELIDDLEAASAPTVQPVFIENADDATDPYEVGDEVRVTLDCDFGFLTPLVGNIVGDPLTISATSTFMIFGGEIAGVPVPVDPVPAGCIGTDLEVPNLVKMTVQQARDAWTSLGFTGSFTPSTGSDDNIVTGQTTSPTASVGSCLLFTASVSVSHKVPDECDDDETLVPLMIGGTVQQARSAWTGAGFTGGFTPLTGSNTDSVDGFTITPDNVPEGECALLTSQINVDHTAGPPAPGECEMPQLLGLSVSAAQSAYTTEGFKGTFSYSPNQSTWLVESQDLVGGQNYACTANVKVSVKKP
jgi:hypothetical protein